LITYLLLIPTTAGVDGEERAFTPLPGWAVGLTTRPAACRP